MPKTVVVDGSSAHDQPRAVPDAVGTVGGPFPRCDVEELATDGPIDDGDPHNSARIPPPRAPSDVRVGRGCGIADGIVGGVDESPEAQRVVDVEDRT